MRCIGVRAAPSFVYYTIIDIDNDCFEILTCSKLIVPKALDIPERLSFIRNCLFSIIQEYAVVYAGIRTIETLVNPDIERIYIEGVIQELISNCTIEKYFTGKKSKLATLLNVKVEDITQYLDGDKVFSEIEEWSKYDKSQKESIITAVAAGIL